VISFASTTASRKYEDNRGRSKKEETSNPPSPEHQSAAQRILAEAIEQEKVGLEGLPAARFQLLNHFGRIERLGEQVAEAFGGQPFWRNLPPDCPANRRRFNAYFDCLTKVSRLLLKATDLWMLTCGIKEGRRLGSLADRRDGLACGPGTSKCEPGRREGLAGCGG
jgi:hypothetical protein